MEQKEFEEQLIEHAEKLQIKLNEKQINQFYKYMNLLVEWNKNINLTAITDPYEIILKHFIDSLTINKCIKENAKIMDVGTGAGFPGIPLKIVREDIEVVLMDSLNKRINFLNEVLKELDLKNIEAIHSRAEEAGKNSEYREKFDYATSRAVANMATLSEYLLPFVKLNGEAICMKGPDIKEELEKAKIAIKVLGGKISQEKEFLLPKSDIKRNIIIIRKIENTPKKYPRKAGVPAKLPIG